MSRIVNVGVWLFVLFVTFRFRAHELVDLMAHKPHVCFPIIFLLIPAIKRYNLKVLIPFFAILYGSLDTVLLWKVPANTNLSGTIIAITGANTGIGRESAIQLADLGATVLLACRNVDACKEIALARNSAIKKPTVPGGSLVVGPRFDLADTSSGLTFARWVGENYDRLDVLINNAGFASGGGNIANSLPPFAGKQGPVEPFVGYMHLGHFSLTRAMVPSLQKESASRKRKPLVVNVSSIAADVAFQLGIDFHISEWDLSSSSYPPYESANAIDHAARQAVGWLYMEEKFTHVKGVDPEAGFIKYCRAKQANALFTQEIPRRYKGITSKSWVPAFINTDIGEGMVNSGHKKWFIRDLPAGVRGLMRTVLDTSNEDDCVGHMTQTFRCLSRYSFILPSWNAEKAAKRLWEWSEANV